MVKCGETPLEGEGHVKTRETLYVWSMCMMVLWRLLCWIHVDEHSVHARLDYWIWSQNCRNTLLWHECSTSESTKWDAVMADTDELSENSNPLLRYWYFKVAWSNGCEASRVYYCIRRELRSSCHLESCCHLNFGYLHLVIHLSHRFYTPISWQ